MTAEAIEYLAFDLETTGLSARTDRVVEFGAVRFAADGRELGRFEQLVNPERPMSPGRQMVNGLSDALLASQPVARDVLPSFLEFLGDPVSTTLLAHNASFDASFLGQEIARLGLPPLAHAVVDTLPLARSRLPHLRNHRLDTLARALNLDPTGPHRALADSLRVKGLWLALNGQGGSTHPPANVAYRVEPEPRPSGWESIEEAIAQGHRVRIEYSGGTRGSGAREITPRYFDQRGGVSYLVAFCHIDAIEKKFRLDRVLRFEVLAFDLEPRHDHPPPAMRTRNEAVARLLVSVRSAEEARAAVEAGASVIDIKEPTRGPLGMADVSVWADVRHAVPSGTTLSVALGELRDWTEELAGSIDSASFHGFSFRKLGLAGAGASWADRWTRLTSKYLTGPSWIAVIYADWPLADAPDPEAVLDAAIATDQCAGVLVDTWDKSRPSPVDLSWRPLFERVRRSGKLSALAGRLSLESVDALAPLCPDLIAVRGAACENGDRSAAISPSRVSALSRLAARI